MRVKITERDIKQSIIVDPAWYRVIIDEVEDKASKDGKSINSWYKGRIICHADSGDKKYEGVPTPYLWLSNEAVAPLAMFRACGFSEAEVAGAELDTQAMAGKVLEMFIGNAPDNNGVIRNSTNGQFRVARAV